MTDKQWDDDIETVEIDGASVEEQHEIIHILTVRRLIEMLRSTEVGHKYSTITAAQRFLRDNNVQGFDIPGNASTKIREALENRAPFRLTGTDE